jgi:hypothetical protein
LFADATKRFVYGQLMMRIRAGGFICTTGGMCRVKDAPGTPVDLFLQLYLTFFGACKNTAIWRIAAVKDAFRAILARKDKSGQSLIRKDQTISGGCNKN